jgi:hypothetical protein
MCEITMKYNNMCAGIEIDPYVTRAQNGGRACNSVEHTDHRTGQPEAKYVERFLKPGNRFW